ncbi:MAG: DUF5131 family protein [Brevinema sp.]
MKKKIISLNPVVGCTIGCPYCYAQKINASFPQIKEWAKPQFFPERLKTISKRKKSSVFFLTTMSDPSDWEPVWIEQIMNAICLNPQHHYLFLTKRPEKLHISGEGLNIWLGCTITQKQDLHRLDMLQKIPSYKKFISFEPLLSDIGHVDLSNIDWAWIGAETGTRINKVICKKEWVENIIQQCSQNNVPFHLNDSLKNLEIMTNSQFPPEFMEDTLSLF